MFPYEVWCDVINNTWTEANKQKEVHVHIGKQRVIALYGYPGSGKDTVADILVELGGWERVAFADPLKEMLVAIDPWCDWDGEYQHARLSELIRVFGSLEAAKRFVKDIRTYLQKLGKEAGRDVLGEDVWVNAALARIFAALERGSNVVVTDVRFVNEYRTMCDLGAVIVEVRRPCYGACNGHDSEKHYDEFLPNYILHNEGSLADLRANVDVLLTDIMSK